MQKKRLAIGTMVLLWMSGICFLFLFSYMTSPLFPWAYGWDAAFFQLVGSGMTKGYLPYRDFYDMKGPWLFFIEYAGQRLWYGKTGIFILQCASLCTVLFLAQATYWKYFKDRVKSHGSSGINSVVKTNLVSIVSSLAMVLPLYIVLSATMEGGNLTEEWSLPFLFWPMYLSLDFIKSEAKEHKPLYGFVYGTCFGVIALIRITNAVMICAIVLTIMIYLIKDRQWKNLWRNAGAFVLGVAVAFVPPLFYFGYFGEIGSMLACVFVFGFLYGTEGFQIGTGGIYLLVLLFPILIFILTKQVNKRLWTLVLANAAGMMITLGMGNSTLHDYMLVIPGMMFGVWRLFEAWQSVTECHDEATDGAWKGLSGQKTGKRYGRMGKGMGMALIVAIILCFAYPCYKMAGAGALAYRQFGNDSAYQNVMETVACIPEEERGSVWGYEAPLRWYTIADIMPYHRYCGWQEHYMALSKQIASEIEEMLESCPPEWIVTKKEAAIENAIVREKLQEDYAPAMENGEYRLYQRKS
ncbi:MAG: hypothetical protein K2P65_16680 [Lachnospiraceae bacterium]|nr:hypothetical protein [Lachnospiraceae bacterium]